MKGFRTGGTRYIVLMGDDDELNEVWRRVRKVYFGGSEEAVKNEDGERLVEVSYMWEEWEGEKTRVSCELILGENARNSLDYEALYERGDGSEYSEGYLEVAEGLVDYLKELAEDASGYDYLYEDVEGISRTARELLGVLEGVGDTLAMVKGIEK